MVSISDSEFSAEDMVLVVVVVMVVAVTIVVVLAVAVNFLGLTKRLPLDEI